ncbi:MAG: cation diffusion facilitator family transporter [Lachnospiraceae bacterium]|jgi:cation diffusion facilitator family transporter|nr:cation diffusion facilitator family transporter [Lachnospiraceae bacterium]
MINFLARLFIRDYRDVEDRRVRSDYGKMSGYVGIGSNILLFAIKLLAGILSNSVAIIADAVNNLMDSMSSIVTVVGFKVSAKPADEDHPFGHARSEYIAGMIVAFVILVVGAELFTNSFHKILYPTGEKFENIVFAILIVSILIKLWQSSFYYKVGKLVDSETIIATGTDSRNDVISTLAVLIGAIIMKITSVDLDGYFGVGVAIFIIVSGISLFKDTISPLLGVMPSKEMVKSLKDLIMEQKCILGIHDMVIHNYGYGETYATVHVEVANTCNFVDIHDVIDNIEKDAKDKLGVSLVIHMDPVIVDDPEVVEMSKRIKKITKEIDEKLSMHDFRMVKGNTHTNLIFDVVVPTEINLSNEEILEKYKGYVKEFEGKYYVVINFDNNYVPLGAH